MSIPGCTVVGPSNRKKLKHKIISYLAEERIGIGILMELYQCISNICSNAKTENVATCGHITRALN